MQPRIPEVTLLEELGRGQGSVVFRALHHGSGCTVKLPSDRPRAPQRTDAFEQDLLQLARLTRAGLPRVLQIGATDDTSYAILDEAEGESLARMLCRPLRSQQVIELAQKVVACLRELHDAGFVHGDLTPEHIVLSRDGQRVSLLDRGSVARPVHFDARIDTHALGLALRECSTRLDASEPSAQRLMQLAEELARAERVDLAAIAAELEACAASGASGTKRSSTYPPPGAEALAPLPPLAASAPPRRARGELAQLQRACERAVSGQGLVIGVLGAAGSGKSRMLAALADSLSARDLQVLSVRCRNSDWAPFSTLKRLLDSHLAGLAALDPARRAEIEASLCAAAGPLASRARLLSPRLAEVFRDAPATIAEGDAQQVFVAGMAEFLAKYLEWSGRSIVVIDDVHWLDASSRLVLSRLAARVCPQGHVFVCGARDDAESREPLERFRAALLPEFSETLRLGPLSLDDAGQVIAEYLGLDATPPELVDQLAQLSDGTPLCLLELLRSTLEHGLLKPLAGSWQLDAAQVQRMRLPASSQALIEQRLAKLDPVDLRVLRAAAVLRNHIDPKLLARVADLGRAYVEHALDCAVASHLLEFDANGNYGFVHDTVWEALLRELRGDARRALHQRVADALFAEGGQGADYEYELARHYASGVIERDPARVFETNRRAARRALEACDDALALSFLKPAEHAAELAGLYPGRELFVQLAETYLRTGDTAQSLAYFERSLVCSKPGFERAHVRGRIAWIHHFNANATACRDALEVALAESGRFYPRNHVGGLARAASRWLAGSVRDAVRSKFTRRRAEPLDRVAEQEARAVCQLYTECFRVAFDSGHPFSVIASVLSLAQASRDLGPCRAVVHADLLMALFFSTLGLSHLAQVRFDRAERMARELGDPIAQTLVHAVLHAITGWRGDLVASEREARLCVDERGHWMELGELCYVCFALYAMETARGRPEAALAWIERAIERVRQSGRAPAIFALIEDAAIVSYLALGREREIRGLERRLRFVEHAALENDGAFHVHLYQTRVQRFTETGDLGAGFEALVDEFDALRLNPRQAHILVSVYYVHVAHARVHQCLRAEPAARAALLPKLERAARDLDAIGARIKNLEVHCHIIRAAQCFFTGDLARAKRLIADAERVAERHGCPWVMWAASRLTAHILRAEGNEAAARDRARIAALWAERYGQHSRLRFICEEFDLDDVLLALARTEVEPPSTQRNLDALLRISQANSRELGPDRQACLILDELIEALGADRALLFMRTGESEPALALAAGRRAGAGDLGSGAAYDRALVEQVYATGQTQVVDGAPGDRTASDRACIVVALVLREQVVGVLYLDRPELEGSFRGEDAALLQALANQVSLALELGSSLREREQLQKTLQQARTMEAVGRLAGGIAHDFNNILSAIQFAANSMVLLAAQGKIGHEDLEDIQRAARRGADLTRQLLGLSRGKTSPPPPRRVLLGEAVRDLLPMLRRLVRHDVRIVVDIASESLAVMADLSQIERVLMNLCQNASDAMPHGGTITIRVAPFAPEPGVPAVAGTSHVLLSVSDTGTGMNEEVRTRLFEPFFTTKSSQRGTGLGLANVYAIVQQCHGTIDVTSELGAGSCFRIALPRTPAPEQPHVPLRFVSEVRPAPAANSDKTVLVVDDDDTVRRMVVRTLELGGYRVLSAPNGEAALRIAASHEGLFNLVVTDMHMPGMDGSQLGRTLLDREPALKMLFLSGDASDDLEDRGLLSRDAAFLHKPFPPDLLLSHVREALKDEDSAEDVQDSVG